MDLPSSKTILSLNNTFFALLYLLGFMFQFPCSEFIPKYFHSFKSTQVNPLIFNLKCLSYTATVNIHRMAEVGGELWDHLAPPLLKQGAQAHIQVAPKDLSKEETPQTLPVLSHPQSNKALPDGDTNLLVFQFMPNASCPATAHH